MRVGVLGMGSIGQRHHSNIFHLGHDLASYDPVYRGSFSYQARENVIQWADAVVICSPSKDHAKDVMDVIDAGKHVLCEKPFGYDCPPLLAGFIQGTRLKNPHLIVATGFNLRFHDCVRRAKELLPEIGRINGAAFTVNQKTEKPPYLRDGIIRNWLSHEIDLARHLLGSYEEVVSCTAPVDGDGNDSIEAHVVIKFPSVRNNVHFQADYYSDPEQRYFWIDGEHGALYCDLVKRNLFMRGKDGKHRQVLAATDSWDGNYRTEMEYFISSIESGQHVAPLASAEDGVNCLYAVMAAREKAGI